MKIVVTVFGDDESDLTFIRSAVDAAVETVLIDNESRFDGQVWHETEMADGGPDDD